MNFQEYEADQQRTAPHVTTIDKDKAICLMSMGLAGETGELVDAMKKDVFHSVPVSPAYVLEELGDILWYLTGMARVHNISLEQVAIHNVEKLRKRYPDGFVKGGGVR